MEKGFAPVIIIFIVIITTSFGFYTYKNTKNKPTDIPVTTSSPTATSLPTPTQHTPKPTTYSTHSPSPKPTGQKTPLPTSTNQSSTKTNSPVQTQSPTQPPTQAPTQAPTPAPTSPPSTSQTFQNGNASVTLTCSNPNIDIVLNFSTSIPTSPDGVWTYIKINETGKNIYLAYNGTSSSYTGFNGALIRNQHYSLRNGDLLTLQSGKSYSAKASRGAYTSSDPTSILGSTLAEVGFTINCNF